VLIEAGTFTNQGFPNAVAGLYTPGALAEPFMRRIITHWSTLSDRDMKGGRLAPADAARRPAGPPQERTNGQSARNGVPQLAAEPV
jgi:hypothetical protein